MAAWDFTVVQYHFLSFYGIWKVCNCKMQEIKAKLVMKHSLRNCLM